MEDKTIVEQETTVTETEKQEKTFTQTEVDALISKRVGKQEARDQRTKNEILSDLGINEDGVTDYKKWLEDQKTETEKQNDLLEDYKTQIQGYKNKEFQYEAKEAARDLGINLDMLDQALILAKANIKEGQTIRDGFEFIKENIGGKFLAKEAKVKAVINSNILTENTETKPTKGSQEKASRPVIKSNF